MFAEQRMEIIKQILKEQKHANISTLSLALRVSDVTVRKYLDILEKQGYLTKVHCDAIWTEEQTAAPTIEPDLDEHLEAIAQLAATLVDESDSVYIGPGLACAALAKHIADKSLISVITNNFLALNYLAHKVCNLSFLGGDVTALSNGSTYTYSSKTQLFLENMAISKAFVGCDGIDISAGITAHSLPFTEMIQHITSISRELNVLSVSQKFGRVALYRICPLGAPLTIVTDSCVTNRYKQYCYEQGVRLLTAYENM